MNLVGFLWGSKLGKFPDLPSIIVCEFRVGADFFEPIYEVIGKSN